MANHLKELVDGDSEFLKEPTAVAEWLKSLGRDKLEELIVALRSRDKKQIAVLTGLSEDQAADAFKALKERAAQIAKKYPALDALPKHGH